MKIASLYPFTHGKEVMYPAFDWDFIRSLLNYSEEINDFHVFLPVDGYPHKQDFPNISNVFIHSTMELAEFFQENSIDIWHDFGHADVSHLTYIRGWSCQNFPITQVVDPLRFLSNPDSICNDLTEYDALICLRSSICRIIHSAYQQTKLYTPSSAVGPEILTIPPGIDNTENDIFDKQDVRYLLDLPDQTIITLCLTDFSVYEGGDLFPLIRAFETVIQKHKDIQLIISGTDKHGYAEKIQKYIEESNLHRYVVLRPNASNSARSLLLSAANIFISPFGTIHHKDNQRQVLQAMCHGLPVIATDDDENGWIEHGKNGLKLKRVCQPSSYKSLNEYLPFVSEEVRSLIISQGIAIDTQQIVEFLTTLIENEDLCHTLGKAARRYVVEHHQWSTIVEKYIYQWHTLRKKSLSKSDHTIESKNQKGKIHSLLPSSNNGILSIFSFMSQDIKDNTSLHLTFSGEKLLKTQHITSYDAMKDIICIPVVLEILNQASSVSTMPEIINSLLQLVDQDDAEDLVPNITYHIMWCLKQGFICLSREGR